MSVQVEFPDELLIATREEPDVFQRQVMIFTLGQPVQPGSHLVRRGCSRIGM